MVPPIGAIIIGPCPQCKELVVVFCGQVLPLDKTVMESGTIDERREHLLAVLTEFLQERITSLITEDTPTPSEIAGEDATATDEPQRTDVSSETNPISQTEMDRFADVDLKLLDNKAYFDSVFKQE